MDYGKIWIYLAVLFGIAFGQNPEIVNDILPDIQRVGLTAKLNCTVARLGNFKVQWSFKGEGQIKYVISIDNAVQVINNYQGGVPQYEVKRFTQDAEQDRTTFQLVIARIRPDFSGKYECMVIMPAVAFQHWTRKAGTLTVLYSPIIKPGSTTFVKLVHRGADSSIHCDAQGVPAPNITWTRSDGHLLPTGKAMSRGKTLTIRGADVEYTGVYRCVADNQIRPPAEALAQVYVYQAPAVRVVQDSVGQQANGRYMAKLDCIVQGYPTPTVNWGYYEGDTFKLIISGQNYKTSKQVTDMQHLMNGEQWYTLKIENIQERDFKKYYCVAKNNEGKMNATIILFSTTICQGPLCDYIQAVNNNAEYTRLSPVALLPAFLMTMLLMFGL